VPVWTLRTARVTSAPAEASTLAVSMPIPELAPVTMARRPCRSTSATISAAVVVAPYAVVGIVNSFCDTGQALASGSMYTRKSVSSVNRAI
jgi:hypothetical protein